MLVFGQTALFFYMLHFIVLGSAAIAITGGMMSLSDLFSQSLMQGVVRNEQRGRAMGAWVVSVGSTTCGAAVV